MRLAPDDEGAGPMSDSADDDGRLLAAARAGSREALGRALEDCRRYLLAIAERQLEPDLRAKGGASDLVQETFLEAQRDFGQFQGASSDELRGWLRQVLNHNLGAFTRRFRTTSKRAVAREVGLPVGGRSGEFDDEPAGSTLTPSGVAIEHEQALALRRAIERLPDEYRQVVVFRFEEGRSFEEIGRLTGRTPDAARKVWCRAMVRLREEWEGQL
jgi:RNA polymerase sigma-70 factor (ECF subfamily)